MWTGQPASELIFAEDGSLRGVASGDTGIGKDGAPKDRFERGEGRSSYQMFYTRFVVMLYVLVYYVYHIIELVMHKI